MYMFSLRLFGAILLCCAVQFDQSLRVMHQLDLGNIELIVLSNAVPDSRSSNMMLVTVKVPYSILQIAKRLGGVTRVAQKVRIVNEPAHCSLAVDIDAWAACEEREDCARQALRFLASMLLESGKALGEMLLPNKRLQNG